MNLAPARPDELRDLLDAVCENPLDAASVARLESLLLADDDACRYCLTYLSLHGAMLIAGGHLSAEQSLNALIGDADMSGRKVESGKWPGSRESRVESRELRVELEADFPESPNPRIPEIPVINHQIPTAPLFTLHSPLSTLHAWAVSYTVATLFLAVAMLGAWSYTITHPDADTFANNSRRVTTTGATAIKTPDFTFVGRVSGMVDCQWAEEATATSPGAAVALNRRYALKSGLMELTYDSGAKVILQGPCEYTVESSRGGFLKVGKLVARVGAGGGERGAGASGQWPVASGQKKEERGERREESAKPQAAAPESPNPRTPNPKSPTPHAPRPTPLFAVRTPTALVEDLGTEFGVEVSDSGETASHVFQGQVRVKVEGAWGEGRGAGDKNPESPNPRIPNPEVILSAGQSARVAKDAKSGEVKLLSGEKDFSAGSFVRNLIMLPGFIDLADLAAGGNGLASTPRKRGINPASGWPTDEMLGPQQPEFISDGEYHRTPRIPFVDGVFIPDGGKKTAQTDSTGRTFAGFRSTANTTFQYIWAGRPTRDCYPSKVGGVDYASPGHGLLLLHANSAITFDLADIRYAYRHAKLLRFRAVTADTGTYDYACYADVWVLVDGEQRFLRRLCKADGAVPIVVPLDDREHFLTLAVTDANDGAGKDWVIFGDPRLELSPRDTEDHKHE